MFVGADGLGLLGGERVCALVKFCAQLCFGVGGAHLVCDPPGEFGGGHQHHKGKRHKGTFGDGTHGRVVGCVLCGGQGV